jgi:hypothetical protein
MTERLGSDRIIVESSLMHKETGLIWTVTHDTRLHVVLLMDMGWSHEPQAMVVAKDELTTDVWTSWEYSVEDAQYDGWGYQG